MKKIIYKCDSCKSELEIDVAEYEKYEFDDAGWTLDRNTSDTHYCNECSELEGQ